MNIIGHGKWVPYTPAVPPKDYPANVLYLQRDDDAGADWYVYSRDPTSFGVDTVKFMALYQGHYGSYVIGPATTDVTVLFPRDQVVGEITDYVGDPEELTHKLYDPLTKTITEYVPPDPGPTIFDRLTDLEARVAALEKTKK